MNEQIHPNVEAEIRRLGGLTDPGRCASNRELRNWVEAVCLLRKWFVNDVELIIEDPYETLNHATLTVVTPLGAHGSYGGKDILGLSFDWFRGMTNMQCRANAIRSALRESDPKED